MVESKSTVHTVSIEDSLKRAETAELIEGYSRKIDRQLNKGLILLYFQKHFQDIVYSTSYTHEFPHSLKLNGKMLSI